MVLPGESLCKQTLHLVVETLNSHLQLHTSPGSWIYRKKTFKCAKSCFWSVQLRLKSSHFWACFADLLSCRTELKFKQLCSWKRPKKIKTFPPLFLRLDLIRVGRDIPRQRMIHCLYFSRLDGSDLKFKCAASYVSGSWIHGKNHA